MTKPIRDIVMAESTRSYTSNALSVPEWNDQYDSSITTVSAMTPHTPTRILCDNSSVTIPPDEVYIPAPAGTTTAQNESAATSQPAGTSLLADDWSTGNLTSKRLDDFATKILPEPVQIQLAQPFGKDSIRHSFYAEKCLRHVLLPLLKSEFLTCRATKSFERASRQVRQLQIMRKKQYKNVNFLPLQGFQSDWEETTTIRDDWKTMTSACLLHFDGDVATMV
jgi:hypothetical protein